MVKKLINKLIFQTFKTKNYISDYFPLLNINNNKLELKNGEEIRIFRKPDFFNSSIYKKNELEFIYNYFNNYFKNSKSGEGFSILIKLTKNNKTFEKKFKEPTNLNILKIYKAEKLKFFKEHNNKFIDVFIGTSSYFYNSSFITLMDKLDYEQLDNEQLFSFLYDHFNPSFASNDLEINNLPITTKEELLSGEYSLLQTLYKSYIDTDAEYFSIGNTKCEVYNIVSPAETFDINKLIKDLSKLKSNIAISIKTKKDDKEFYLNSKKTFAGSSLLSMNGINRRISSNIKLLLEHLKDTHTSLCTVNITLFLYNDNIDELKEDKLNFEEWNGVKYIYNRYNRAYEFIYAIPGLNVNGNHSIILSSDNIADLCLPTQYYKDYSTSIFFDKNNIIQPFPYRKKNLKDKNRDSSKDRKINNGAIIAPTRSGKSVLLNYILLNKLFDNYDQKNKKFDTYGLLIDFGNSYTYLIQAINEELKPENRISYKSIGLENKYNILDMNFGYDLTMKDINNKTYLLKQFFNLAFEEISEKEEILLEKGIKKTYELFLLSDDKNFKNKYTDDEGNERYYWDDYINSNKTDVDSFLKAMPTITDITGVIAQDKEIKNTFSQEVEMSLNDKLSTFIGSQEGSIFSETSTELLLSDILIIDFEQLTHEAGGKLPPLLLQMLINYKYQEFISDRLEGKEKFIFIDEYPQFLKIEPKIAKTVDFLLKTGQKKELDIFIISQNINSLDPDFFPNLGTLTLFNLNLPAEIKRLSEVLSIDIEYFDPIKELEFVKNKFSDLMVIEISNEKLLKTILRFSLTDLELDILTKHRDEVRLKNIYKKNNII